MKEIKWSVIVIKQVALSIKQQQQQQQQQRQRQYISFEFLIDKSTRYILATWLW